MTEHLPFATKLWPLLAFGFSFMGALIIGFNQWAQVDGRKLLVLRALGVLPVALLGACFLPWPQEIRFYVVAAVSGVLLAYGDTLLFNASSSHGGRLTALYVPLKMLIGFVIWAVLEPQSLLPLLIDPWRLVLLVLGFGLCGGALMFIRRVDASVAALLAVLPVAIIYAVCDVISKVAMGEGGAGLGAGAAVGSALAFLTVTSTVGTLGGVILGGTFKPTWREVWRSMLFGWIFVVGIAMLLLAIALSPNPGYVAAITMLSSLWLAIYGWWRRGEVNNWWAGVALLAGAVAVALGTA